MIAKDTLTEEQYRRLLPYDQVLTKLAQNRYVNFKNEVDLHPELIQVYGEVYKRVNGRAYVHRKSTCGSCSGANAWAKRLGRYFINHKTKLNGK